MPEFSSVFKMESTAKTSQYCKHDSQILASFTSSLYGRVDFDDQSDNKSFRMTEVHAGRWFYLSQWCFCTYLFVQNGSSQTEGSRQHRLPTIYRNWGPFCDSDILSHCQDPSLGVASLPGAGRRHSVGFLYPSRQCDRKRADGEGQGRAAEGPRHARRPGGATEISKRVKHPFPNSSWLSPFTSFGSSRASMRWRFGLQFSSRLYLLGLFAVILGVMNLSSIIISIFVVEK